MSEAVQGKRGCSDRENSRIKSSNFNDEDVAKRVCISPPQGNWISSLEGNVASSISNINGENRGGDLLELGCREGFKSSADVGTDCNNGGFLRGKSVVICNSKVPVVDNDDNMVLDLGGEAAVSVNVNELDCADGVVDSRGKIGCFDDGSLPYMDKTASQDSEGPNLTVPMGGGAISSISSQACYCSKPDLLKEREIRAIAEIVCENSSYGDEVLVDSSEKCKGKDSISLMYLDRGNTYKSADIKTEFGDSLPAGDNCPHDGRDFNVDESKASAEGTLTDIINFQNDGDNHNTDDLVLSQYGPFSFTSQEYIVHGLEKSKELKEGHKCALSERTDSIKACSCSFCTKAAHIWLDLNYKDVKGRVSAIRKIQKEASILSENTSRISKSESELMYQWKPLFESMANVWEEEGNQLEARLQTLTGLREKCKTDLELMILPQLAVRCI
ncbi:hypothetical protein C2S53_005678 [Perilla frutescens var. hirtella]|uniref:Uncharacterized protein n=1 Tax=Perilla frutescens var. hirtella TaxID=608512 RepID=A0AAD4IVN1_PERFH|nr:hypothetical protein C2S53_005678 [Perilla frutescens var. hirtella]